MNTGHRLLRLFLSTIYTYTCIHTYTFRKRWRGVYIDFREASCQKKKMNGRRRLAERSVRRRAGDGDWFARRGAIICCARARAPRRCFQRSEIALPRLSLPGHPGGRTSVRNFSRYSSTCYSRARTQRRLTGDESCAAGWPAP